MSNLFYVKTILNCIVKGADNLTLSIHDCKHLVFLLSKINLTSTADGAFTVVVTGDSEGMECHNLKWKLRIKHARKMRVAVFKNVIMCPWNPNGHDARGWRPIFSQEQPSFSSSESCLQLKVIIQPMDFHDTIQYNTIQYNTIQYNTIQLHNNACMLLYLQQIWWLVSESESNWQRWKVSSIINRKYLKPLEVLNFNGARITLHTSY